jgi:DNA polymerase I-like protein with 3'-5' exonuclease and polymerase domains
LKAHSKGHEIVCASVATSENEVYVFMMPKKRSSRQPFISMLENEEVKKVSHNMKYENSWTYNCLYHTKVKGWFHDTMQAAHILDNRTGVTGLKFQVYVSFGIVNYDGDISPILSSDDSKNANAMNKLVQYVKVKENAKKVMEYCALDSAFTFRLYLQQIREIEELQLPF